MGEWADVGGSESFKFFTTTEDCPLTTCEIKTKASECKDDYTGMALKTIQFTSENDGE